MNKNLKICLGALAFWPLAFLLGMLSATLVLQYSGEQLPGPMAYTIGQVLFWITFAVVLAQLIGYAYYIIRADNISRMGKFQYLALLLVGHLFTLPLIWRTLVWQERFFKKTP